MKTIPFFLLCLCLSLGSYSQSPDTTSRTETSQQHATSSILGNASLSTPTGPLLPPRIGLRTYKLSANIINSWWDLYLHNNLPTFLPNAKDSVAAFGNEILNQLGGVLNISLSKVGYFGNGGDKLNRDIKGALIDFRFGAKLIDPPTRNYSEFLVPAFQTSLDFRYLIPLVESKNVNASDLRTNLLGNLSLRFYSTYQKIFNSETYGEYFKSRKGNPAATDIISMNYELNLFITNVFYLSFGQSFSNVSTIPDRTVFSFSYSAHLK